MCDRVISTLHDIHTAPVLKGYHEMSARAEPEIKGVIERLTNLHQQHANRDVLPSVRSGEESLRDEHHKATRDVEVAANPAVARLLKVHIEAISAALSSLPKD